MSDPTSAEYADALDASDELAAYRQRFVGSDSPLVYFDGNSLGRPLKLSAERLGGSWSAQYCRNGPV